MGRVRSASPRRRLARHRRLLAEPAIFHRWLLVAALALTTGLLTARLVGAAATARQRWGETRTVLVARHPVRTGQPLAGAVREVRWPVALIPAETLRHLPRGAKASGPLAAGTPVTRAALLRARGSGAAIEGRDRARVAVPAGSVRLPLTRGDRVDVWATVDPSLTDGELATRRVATGAVVSAASTRTVVVAVRIREVPDVAEAVALATVTLVATG